MRRTLSILSGGLVALTFLAACGPGDPPDPQADDVMEARAAEADQIEQALDEVVLALDGETVGRSRLDECYEGQRNYKVDTGYSYRCTLRMGTLVGLDGDFRTTMLDLDAELASLGWESDGELPGQLVDDYWDMRLAESDTGRVRIDRLPGPLGIFRDENQLGFDYGSTLDERGLTVIDRAQRTMIWCCRTFYSDSELIDLTGVSNDGPEHLVLVTVEGHYWER